MTKGLFKSCNRKNKLYEIFLQNKTVRNERVYKDYKNKLTSLVQFARRQYYVVILDRCKGNAKERWKVLNGIVNRNVKSSVQEEFYDKNKTVVTNKQEKCDGFNKFFVNVGSSLAKSNKAVNNLPDVRTYMGSPNNSSMYVRKITEKELLNIVNTLRPKTSKDCYGLNMDVVKKNWFHILLSHSHMRVICR